jgi:hypothetical protein
MPVTSTGFVAFLAVNWTVVGVVWTVPLRNGFLSAAATCSTGAMCARNSRRSAVSIGGRCWPTTLERRLTRCKMQDARCNAR